MGTKDLNTESLRIDSVLSKVSEYNLWCYYTGLQIKLGKKILSPLRKESNPSAAFFVSNTGSILLKDFSTNEVYSLFSFLKYKYNWAIPEALRHIDSDFNLGFTKKSLKKTADTPVIYSTPDFKEENYKKILVKRSSWRVSDLKYWSEYNISRNTLDFYNISSLKCYWIVKLTEAYQFCRAPDELLFLFSFGNALYKIYRPNALKGEDKWYSNVPKDVLMGHDQLPWFGDILIITKGMKELCLLHELEYPAVALQGETSYPGTSLVTQLTKRFKSIYTLMDNDSTGKKAAAYFKNTYNFSSINLPDEYLPKGKDFAEISKIAGVQKLKNIIYEGIKEGGYQSVKG